MQPTLTGIGLITEDVLALATFYAELLDTTVDGDERFATVKAGGARLGVFSMAGMEQMVPGSMAGAGNGRFTIEVNGDDVDARDQRLRAGGGTIAQAPTTPTRGRRAGWGRGTGP